ncbi:MAG: hypothetical protein BWY06_01429 [Candidatus Latescibacteria bacterium ADurb.Bin168]|nr:MAG: hypothetical protein BWY06_01429 [Candidatus Latescibacteria bacterium ADurb.Bin168]
MVTGRISRRLLSFMIHTRSPSRRRSRRILAAEGTGLPRMATRTYEPTSREGFPSLFRVSASGSGTEISTRAMRPCSSRSPATRATYPSRTTPLPHSTSLEMTAGEPFPVADRGTLIHRSWFTGTDAVTQYSSVPMSAASGALAETRAPTLTYATLTTALKGAETPVRRRFSRACASAASADARAACAVSSCG